MLGRQVRNDGDRARWTSRAEQTSDDTDTGWGGPAARAEDPAATLKRYLDEKPPHHGD